MSRILPGVIIIVLLFVAAGYYFLNHQKQIMPTPLPEGNVCEPDSMVCKDGTVLKRQLPNCDFPPCPASDIGSSASPSAALPVEKSGSER